MENDDNKCPVIHSAGTGMSLREWWPERLDLSILRQNSVESNPYGPAFDYTEEFSRLDLDNVKKDIIGIFTDSQEWWPADFGNYAPFFVRMAWHAAGTYRVSDGRGGAGAAQQRFPPVNSWPDNVNLDKARRLLWPIKQKYGRSISWGDLMMLAGTVALESMGLKIYGFAGGRIDVYEPDLSVYWGPENKWMGDNRYHGDRDLENPLAASQMGLIYVNPEGPNGIPDPAAAAKDIRETFGRMSMDDEETVALIAGGHTFGKSHGAASPEYLGPAPEGAPVENQGLGWKSSYGIGKGADTVGGGPEVTWTETPTKWSNGFLKSLFENEWELEKSPAGAYQWVAKNSKIKYPDAHIGGKYHRPRMMTTDLALIKDPVYEKIARYFYENPDKFEESFSRAWFKLTHRDLGPKSRYLGKYVPEENLIWQDPIPSLNHPLIGEIEIENLKKEILASGLSLSEMVYTAWSSASTYRNSDKRGGANGARIALNPQRRWEVNMPEQLNRVISTLNSIQKKFNEGRKDGKKVSLADMIVLAGNAAIEQAALNGGYKLRVKFTPGRMDTSQENTDTTMFSDLEPYADGFRNYIKNGYGISQEAALIDRSQLLALRVPEMVALIGGMRVLDANYNRSTMGVFTDRPGVLTNDFFVNLLSMATEWKPLDDGNNAFEGISRNNGKRKWIASRVDLVIGSHSELRAVAEVYASNDGKKKFFEDFAKAWAKVMDLDRFDLRHKN